MVRRGLYYAGAALLMSLALVLLWRAGLPSAPNFSLNLSPDLQMRALADDNANPFEAYQGQAHIINFWATWCAPCLQEMPLLEAAYQDGIPVIGVNAGAEDAQTVAAWVDALGLSFPIMIDESDRRLEAAYRVRGLPTTFFIDAAGEVQMIERGALTAENLRKGLVAIGLQ